MSNCAPESIDAPVSIGTIPGLRNGSLDNRKIALDVDDLITIWLYNSNPMAPEDDPLALPRSAP